MSQLRNSLKIFGGSVLVVLMAAPGYAQATRTWVSGVGDDANPCSRTAPCKTFAGAISKTSTGGEINVLDPGGFGALTITKSIHLRAEGAQEGGVLVSGTNGIVDVNPSGEVVLEGLDIDGLGTGLSGVEFTGGGSLHIERCRIYNFVDSGIDDRSNAGSLFVTDTIISITSTAAATPGSQGGNGAIYISPSTGGGTFVLDNVRIFNNTNFGVQINGSNATAAVNG